MYNAIRKATVQSSRSQYAVRRTFYLFDFCTKNAIVAADVRKHVCLFSGLDLKKSRVSHVHVYGSTEN